MSSDAPDARLSIPEAFQRLLPHYGAARLTRQRLHEALQIGGDDAPGGVRLWVGDKIIDPQWYTDHMHVVVRAGSVELEPTGARPVEGPYQWNVLAADIDALIKLEQEAAVALDRLEQELRTIREILVTLDRLEQDSKDTKRALDELRQGLGRAEGTLDKLKQNVGRGLSARAKTGPKPYDWDLYMVKFYLMLDNDDVAAHANINASDYAGRLMLWGRNNFGARKTPEQTAMREKVTGWKPLWDRLKDANK
jgi:hypothetical protein